MAVNVLFMCNLFIGSVRIHFMETGSLLLCIHRRTSEHDHVYMYTTRDSAYNFSFSYIKRGFVEFQNKR